MGKFDRLHTNQRLLLEELESRGAKIEVLIPELEIVEVVFGERREILVDRDSSLTPYAGSLLASNKYLTKQLLKREGLPVPKGEMFYADQIDDALRFGSKINGPIVLKPPNGSHGDGCVTDIVSLEELRAEIDSYLALRGAKAPFLIEEQIGGIELRIFITRNGDYAALERDPASVIGDGVSSIGELIERSNTERGVGSGRVLCQIPIDSIVQRTLSNVGLSLSSIPSSGSKVYLRRNSNLATGGSSTDLTEVVHASNVDLARRALGVFPGMPFAGVDLLSSDPTVHASIAKTKILEVNSNPGLTMHMRPANGKGRNVAAFVANVLFPQDEAPIAEER